MKKIGEKGLNVQDPTGKMKRVSAEHVQFIYPAEYYLTALPQKEIFARTAKYINRPDLMLDLYKDLEETDKKQRDHSSMQNDSIQVIPIMLLIITICIQVWHTNCNETVTTVNIIMNQG